MFPLINRTTGIMNTATLLLAIAILNPALLAADEEALDFNTVSLEELLDIDIVAGETGGFGKQLQSLQIEPYVHGYVSFFYRDNDINRRMTFSSFNAHYFNMIFGMNIMDKVVAEIMMEYEHGGEQVDLRYGILDYTPLSFLTLRVGKFLVPMGKFNEYYYPEYISKFIDRPYCLWRIAPVVWGEVGIQVRGNFNLSPNVGVNYAFYCVNGLEGDPGSDIRGMRGNTRDMHDDAKAFGGRVGLILMSHLEVGLSLYHGAYTEDGAYSLTIADVDVEYTWRGLSLFGEYVMANQEDVGVDDIEKRGFYVAGAYRINDYIEPAIRYGQADLGREDQKITETLQRVTFSLIVYPLPRLISRFSFKVNYSHLPNNGLGEEDHEFATQAAIGF